MRNIAPDADADPEAALRQFLERFFAQIERRREFYVALVFGSGTIPLGGEGVETHRMTVARRVVEALGLPAGRDPGRARLDGVRRGPGAAVVGHSAAERTPLERRGRSLLQGVADVAVV